MRYFYGTNDSYSTSKGRSVTPEELFNVIKHDVEKRKWNQYHGGREHSCWASMEHKVPKMINNNRLYIPEGTLKEFQQLENMLKKLSINIIPREKWDDW